MSISPSSRPEIRPLERPVPAAGFTRTQIEAGLVVLRLVAIAVVVAALLLDRHATISLVLHSIPNLHWVPVVIIVVFVVTSIVLLDRLIGRIIVRILHRRFAPELALAPLSSDEHRLLPYDESETPEGLRGIG